MKSRLMLSTILLVLLSSRGWAADKMRANIQIGDTVKVGSTELTPGTYRMSWAWTSTESSSDVEVTFVQGKKVVATIPAHITQERSVYDGTAVMTDQASNTLTAVQLSHILLSFTDNDPHPVKSGN